MLEIGPREVPALRDWEDEHDVTYLDAVDRMGVDVVHRWRKPATLPFEDRSFDYIYCSHKLEHIPYYEEAWAFNDLFRVMDEGGQLHIHVPDGKWIGEKLFEERWDVVFKSFMFGGMIDEYDVHVNVFTPNSLVWRLQQTGFGVYEVSTRAYKLYHGEHEGVVQELQVIAVRPTVKQSSNKE